MDPLQLYATYTVLTLVGSSLAVVVLSFALGSTSKQIKLIGELRASVERTCQSCDLARSTAMRASGGAYNLQGLGSIIVFPEDTSANHFIEEADRLIRALASATAETGDLRVCALRRRITEVSRIEADCHALLAALNTGERPPAFIAERQAHPEGRFQQLAAL